MSKYDPLWKWINKNKPDEFLVMTGIEYGNSRLLSEHEFICMIWLWR